MKRAMAAAIALVSLALGVVALVAQRPAKPAALVSDLDVTAFDKSVRPQDDLFKYVNGGWLAKTPIPAAKPRYGSFDMLVDKAQEDLRAIVEDARKTPGAPGPRAARSATSTRPSWTKRRPTSWASGRSPRNWRPWMRSSRRRISPASSPT